MLHRAALLAWRGWGRVEPNPMVGCVLVKGADERGQPRVIGLGHHANFGGPHAEAAALADASRRGESASGATAYVTLEPCHAQGKQPPCSRALVAAGISRVVYARPDPNPAKAGGAAWLASQGVECIQIRHDCASFLSAPFVKRTTTHRPWVIAKWAQTRAGSLIESDDGGRWISCEVARRRVHMLRSRADAVITGIGTVLADDPQLTVRGIRKPRRRPSRFVIDSQLRLPLESAMLRNSLDPDEPGVAAFYLQAPWCEADVAARARTLEELGVWARAIPAKQARGGQMDLDEVLRVIHRDCGRHTVLLEAGPTLLDAFFEGGHIDQVIVHVARTPMQHAWPLGGKLARRLDSAWKLLRRKQVGPDAELVLVREDRLV